VADNLRIVFHGATFNAVYDDALVETLDALGDYRVTRASHVEPHPDGGWTADMRPMGGPTLGPFKLRAEALAAERQWLADVWGL
jgi:hypothetical protein